MPTIKPWKRMPWLVCVGLLVWGVAGPVHTRWVQRPVTAPDADMLGDSLSWPWDEMIQWVGLVHHIRDHYIHEVSSQTLLRYALQGMLEHLDPHSAFLDASAFQLLQHTTQGRFVGVGVEVIRAPDGIQVVHVFPGGPAAQAGVLPGDHMVQLDGVSTESMALQDAVAVMQGAEGEPLRMVVQRGQRVLQLMVIRQAMEVPSVMSRWLEPGYVHVHVTRFQWGSARQLREQVSHLALQQPIRGLVLDVRDNPGGVLDAAVAVANVFLDAPSLSYQSRIVSTRGRTVDAAWDAYATGSDLLRAAPMAVLINRGSASAAEIVAGALQEHRRAVVIGERSFGKGSVQTVWPLNDREGMKLTTAVYLTPSGRSIQHQGIAPDIASAPDTQEADALRWIQQQIAS